MAGNMGGITLGGAGVAMGGTAMGGVGMGGASMGASTLPAPVPSGGDDCNDCTQLVATTKTVQIPCTRNEYKSYTVQVPRTVTERVPRQVSYTAMETREKVVNYTENRTETRYRDEQQSYTVNVPRK